MLPLLALAAYFAGSYIVTDDMVHKSRNIRAEKCVPAGRGGGGKGLGAGTRATPSHSARRHHAPIHPSAHPPPHPHPHAHPPAAWR